MTSTRPLHSPHTPRYTASMALVLFALGGVIGRADGLADATWTRETLHAFPTGSSTPPQLHGPMSNGGLIQDASGFIYGTTVDDGDNAKGSVFRLNPADLSSFTNLHSFAGGDGAYPLAGLTASGGWLYGTTFSAPDETYGKYGTIYRIRPDGSGFESLLQFIQVMTNTWTDYDGAGPVAALTAGVDGTLYGTTSGSGGGAATAFGTCFKYGTSGFTLLDRYIMTWDGEMFGAYDGLALATNGVLYTSLIGDLGTRLVGLPTNAPPFDTWSGTPVMSVSSNLYTFSADFSMLNGPTVGSDGAVYGGLMDRTNNTGSIYRLEPGTSPAAVAIVYTFASGEAPTGQLTPGPDGALYGSSVTSGTSNLWNVFRLDVFQSPAVRTTLYTETLSGDQMPRGKLLYASDGAFYGTLVETDQRGGALFRLIPTETRTAAPSGVGTGADGALTVSGTYFVDGVKTKLTANAMRWTVVLHVASEAGFGTGDEALVLCEQGPGAGTYEFATVTATASGTLQLSTALTNTYDVAGGARVMVQRVPNYTDVTVRSNGVLTASAWTGGASSWTPGGVVAFRAKGTLTIEAGGRVAADALGFAGGAGVSSASQAHGYQGESYGLTVGTKSRDPNLGGGGGGLYFSTDGDGGGGGGGGGHGIAGAPGANVEPYHGLGGSTYGSPDMTSMFLGSGGGAGGTDDDGSIGSSRGGDGGRGGGIVYIAAYTLTIAGSLSASGGSGGTVQDTDGDAGDESGGGGGGSGGTVFLTTGDPPVLTAADLAPGGSGGGVESGAMLGGIGGLGIVAYASVEIGVWSEADFRDTSFSLDRNVISNAAQLAQFAWLVNNGEMYLGRTVSLANDIDLTAHYWAPAGSGFFQRFEGAFDGAGHNVHNIRIDRPATDYQGLFGCVGAEGTVRNVVVPDCDISGQTYVGGIAGRSFGTLSNCTATADGMVSGASYSVGGIVGCAEGALSGCVNGAAVTGGGAVGGVAGEANGTTANCRNSGAVLGNSTVGGVAGVALGTVEDCVNSGSVEATGGEATGGVVGSAGNNVLRCANTGSVEGGLAAGVVGRHSGERIDACRNAGAVTAMLAGGIVTMGESLVRNCVNDGAVFGVLAGGIACELHEGGVARNCANTASIEGMSAAGGLASYAETDAVLENCVNSGAVTASDDAGGLVAYNEGAATSCYWKQTGVAPFTLSAVGTDAGTLTACQSFGDAPGTQAAPVTVGGVTSDRLCSALNAWVAAAWTPGCGLYSWTAGSSTNYPSLVPAIEVAGAVIPQTLGDGFMGGVTAAQIEATVSRYTSAHPGTTAASFGDVLCDADAMGLTFAELSAGDAILNFDPGLAIVGFDRATRTLTFTVSNGIDATATAAMRCLAASTTAAWRVLQMDTPAGAGNALQPTVLFHGDGSADAGFTLSGSPANAFFRLELQHQP